MHRFFAPAAAVSGDRAALGGAQARQIATVLRLEAGDRVTLVIDGEDVEVALERVNARAVEGRVTGRARSEREPRVALTLALPLLRGGHDEEALEGATQLGVARVVPFTSARSVARELGRAKRERWERIATEAAETARRGRVPEIAPLHEWGTLLAALEPRVIVAWEEERALRLRDALHGEDRLSLVIGPEGGLGAEEVGLARARGATVVSLGRRNLRSETAVVAAVAEVMARLD